ncbi:hypothetical protein QE152_g25020 [Popillia japonica]|uniref:Uncharacterized protein n=1 Tax=Popillia japonica TaxID=7064 RepID=A0AAW1K2D6_POPJA
MSFEDDQDNYFIKFIEITHVDNIEVTKSSKDDLMLLATKIGDVMEGSTTIESSKDDLMLLATKIGDVMEGSTTIDFENGYQIEFTNMNLRLCDNYQDEDLATLSETQPIISNAMIIVICAATTSCLLFLIVAIILCRKLSTKATVYKMTIE